MSAPEAPLAKLRAQLEESAILACETARASMKNGSPIAGDRAAQLLEAATHAFVALAVNAPPK